MTEATTFKEAIDNKRFLEAEDMINRGDDILKSQWQFKLSDTFQPIIQNKAFHVLDALIENDHVELDIYEYDSFKNTLFESLILDLDDADESIAFLEKLIPQVDSLNDNLNDDTWLSLAFQQGAHPKVIETMVNNGCDINYKNNSENNVLQLLVPMFSHRLNDQRKLELVEITVNNGIDVNHKNIVGKTALHMALDNNKLEIVEKLLENGADANMPDKEGKTSYYIALIEQRNLEVVQKMAAIYPPDFYAETGRKTSLLYDFIESCYSPSLSETEQEFLKFFAENGADVNEINENGYGEQQTVVDVIVKKNYEFFESFLNTFPIDVNEADNNGDTILHKVCAFNVNFEADKAKDIYRKVKLLLKLGANASLTNTQDKTAANLASDDNLKEKTVALLLKQ